MMISTKGRYALRVMLDLADQSPGQYIPLKTIAQRQAISEKYLENIIAALVKQKLLIGVRGKGGGYQLSKAPKEYTVGSILKSVEGSLAPVSCLECKPNQCNRAEECKALPVWQKLDELIDSYVESITLADLLAQK